MPRDGFVPVFIVVFFSDIGVPLAAKNDCFGDRVYVGEPELGELVFQAAVGSSKILR
jgi:hypothetical protein